MADPSTYKLHLNRRGVAAALLRLGGVYALIAGLCAGGREAEIVGAALAAAFFVVGRLVSRSWIAAIDGRLAWRLGPGRPEHKARADEVVIDMEGDRVWLYVAGRPRPMRLGRARSAVQLVNILASEGAEVLV